MIFSFMHGSVTLGMYDSLWEQLHSCILHLIFIYGISWELGGVMWQNRQDLTHEAPREERKGLFCGIGEAGQFSSLNKGSTPWGIPL